MSDVRFRSTSSAAECGSTTTSRRHSVILARFVRNDTPGTVLDAIQEGGIQEGRIAAGHVSTSTKGI